MERRKARNQALHILYQREITGQPAAEILDTGMYPVDEVGEPSEFCRRIVTGVELYDEQIDETIGAISENWTVPRMPLVDRSILRMAVWEILHADDIPDSVAINEAVEMAKVYGGEDSSKFVNGILGRLAEQHEAASSGSGEA